MIGIVTFVIILSLIVIFTQKIPREMDRAGGSQYLGVGE